MGLPPWMWLILIPLIILVAWVVSELLLVGGPF